MQHRTANTKQHQRPDLNGMLDDTSEFHILQLLPRASSKAGEVTESTTCAQLSPAAYQQVFDV